MASLSVTATLQHSGGSREFTDSTHHPTDVSTADESDRSLESSASTVSSGSSLSFNDYNTFNDSASGKQQVASHQTARQERLNAFTNLSSLSTEEGDLLNTTSTVSSDDDDCISGITAVRRTPDRSDSRSTADFEEDSHIFRAGELGNIRPQHDLQEADPLLIRPQPIYQQQRFPKVRLYRLVSLYLLVLFVAAEILVYYIVDTFCHLKQEMCTRSAVAANLLLTITGLIFAAVVEFKAKKSRREVIMNFVTKGIA